MVLVISDGYDERFWGKCIPNCHGILLDARLRGQDTHAHTILLSLASVVDNFAILNKLFRGETVP